MSCFSRLVSHSGLIIRQFFKVSVCLLSLFVALPVLADSQRFIDYEYDGAGNLISVSSNRNLGPPDVTNLSPAFINKESFGTITATGTNLSKATVSTSVLGVTVISVVNISETEIEFSLSASAEAEIGDAAIEFTTRLGTDTEMVAVAERTPIISTEPNPILLSTGDQNITVKMSFDEAFETDQIYDVQITDQSIATVSQAQITLLAGETEVSVSVSAQTIGSTTLEINQLSNFLALGIPVIVIDEQLPDGSYSAYTKPVGVGVYIEQAANTSGPFVTRLVGVGAYIEQAANTSGPFVTRPVGVAAYIEQGANTSGPFVTRPVGVGAYIEQAANTSGPFVTRPVGVGAYIEQAANTSGPFVTRPVGVGAYIEQAYSTTGPFVAATVGSTYGTAADQVTPPSISQGSAVVLTIDGLELDEVTAISFIPSTGIVQTGALTVSPDGLQITVPINVSASATTGHHTILFTTITGDKVYTDGYFNIAN